MKYDDCFGSFISISKNLSVLKFLTLKFTVGTYSDGNLLVVYDMRRQVFPTAPSPTTTHLIVCMIFHFFSLKLSKFNFRPLKISTNKLTNFYSLSLLCSRLSVLCSVRNFVLMKCLIQSILFKDKPKFVWNCQNSLGHWLTILWTLWNPTLFSLITR